MNFFSVPSDFKEQTIDKLVLLNEKYANAKVIETYGQVSAGSFINSGRASSVIPYADMKSLEKFVRYSSERDIKFHYTLNPSCLGNQEFTEDGLRKMERVLSSLEDIGIGSFTIALPSLFELVKQVNPKFEIKTSAICEINSPGKAAFYKKMGATRIVTDADITREFDKLSNICKVFGDGVEIIVNNVCYKNCPYKMFHYNHDSHCNLQEKDSTIITDYYTNRCSMQKAGGLKNPIKLNWIRPEDLKYYNQAGIHYFKIQGRQSVQKGDLLRTVESYMKQDFDGNLFDLITLFAPYNAFQPYIENKKLDGYVEAFVKKPDFCTELCDTCHYCESYAKKAMREEDVLETNQKAITFYKEYDQFHKIVNKLEMEKDAELVRKCSAVEQCVEDFEF